MRIKWSSTEAQETLSYLSRADMGLEDCLNQGILIRAALSEANPDGENKALQKFTEYYEQCEQQLRKLKENFREYARAVEKSDETFQNAESHICHQADNLSGAEESPVYVHGAGYVSWNPNSMTVLPAMRLQAPIPTWLVNAALETDE